MQTIKHDSAYKYVHPIFQEIELFYSLTSDKHYTIKDNLIEPQVNLQFYYLQQIFNDLGKCDFDFLYYDKEFEKLHLPKYDSKNIVVCFSGGKDSVATLLWYKKREYNVYAYHLRGINAAFPNEHEAVEEICQILDIPLCIEQVSLSGHHEWMEHPMKNMIIASCALQYAIRNNIGIKIAFGNYLTEHLEENWFDKNAGDSQEMWVEFELLIRNVISKFHIYTPLTNMSSTIRQLVDRPDLIDASMSCLCGYRFRQFNRERTEKKYGIKLMRNRCGSCIKCAREYIYLADNNILEYNQKYYLYCLQICYNKTVEGDESIKSFDDLWNANCIYPKSKSKLGKEIRFAKIEKRKVMLG